MAQHRATRTLGLLALGGALALSACGVVSFPDRESPGPSAPASSSVTTTPEAPDDVAATESSSSSSSAAVTTTGAPADWVDALARINEERAGRQAVPLVLDDGLVALAQHQAEHYGAGAEEWDGDFGADLTAAGFAQGSARVGSGLSALDATQAWLASAEVAEPLLDGQLVHVGVASAPWHGEQSVYVIVLGYRADNGTIPARSDGAAEVLTLTNAARAEGGLPALTLNDPLNAAAQSQADHQAEILEMTHDGGGGLGERVAATGYNARVAAENVAVGYPSIAEVVQGWIDSPGHYANIMNTDVTEMGFAVAFGSDGRAYYAQVFGAQL